MPIPDRGRSYGRFGVYRDGRSSEDNALYHHSKRKKNETRKQYLSKNRIYVEPESLYKYHADDPRDATSPYHRQDEFYQSLYKPEEKHGGRKIVYGKIFRNEDETYTRKKGMIIGEKPLPWKHTEFRRPELPRDLFVDNLRHRNIDWKQYDKVTWNDILESHQRDSFHYVDHRQTTPRRNAWLSSLEPIPRHETGTRHGADTRLPAISPRLFTNKVAPPRQPMPTRYISKDRQGNVFYVVGPSDVTNKEYRPHLLPEIVKSENNTPSKLNF